MEEPELPEQAENKKKDDQKASKKNQKNDDLDERLQEERKRRRLRLLELDSEKPEDQPDESREEVAPKKQMAAVIKLDPTALAKLRTKVSTDSLTCTPSPSQGQYTTPTRRPKQTEASPGSALPTPKMFPDCISQCV